MVKQKLSFFDRLLAGFMRCFQDRVADWDAVAFRDDPTDLPERRDRFLEEGLELVQSLGGTATDAHKLVDYVFGRPVGVPHQEMGGTMVCLAALAEHASLDMDKAGEDELARCSTPEIIEKIRRKRSTRHGRGPLPGFSFPDAPRVPARILSFSGEDAALAASARNEDALRKALEIIAEERDAGRHDGLPEACPAHEADVMWGIARAALTTTTGSGGRAGEQFTFPQPQRSRMYEVLRRLGEKAIRSQKITDHEAANAAQREALDEIERLVSAALVDEEAGRG